jgi:hypothetical protein
MIVKPAIRFLLTASDAYVIVIVQAVMAAILANNAIFISPLPTLAVLQTALDAFIAALQAAALGGPAQTAIKHARRAELCALMRLLANYIGAIADGDMSILLLSGFPHQKPTSTSVGTMPKPVVPKVVPGKQTGTLAAATAPVFGASTYNWRVALQATPLVYVFTAQTTAAHVKAAGLAPGEVYLVEVNAVGAAGPGDYSNPGMAMIV